MNTKLIATISALLLLVTLISLGVFRKIEIPKLADLGQVQTFRDSSLASINKPTVEESIEVKFNNEAAAFPDAGEILVCEPLEEDKQLEDILEVVSRAEERYVEFVSILTNSDNFDSKIIAEVMSPSASIDSHIDTLSTYSENFPQSKLATMHLLSACSKRPSHSACSGYIIEKAIKLDGDNGAIWSLISNLKLNKGDSKGAEIALQNAAAAQMYNDFSRLHLVLIDENLPKENGESLMNRFTEVIAFSSFANSIGKANISLSAFCRDNAGENSQLSKTCLDFGKKVKENSDTLKDAIIGVSIIESTYQALGNREASALVAEEHQDILASYANQDIKKAFDLSRFDDLLATSWFGSFLSNGEMAATADIVHEARALSSDVNYNPCN